MDRVQESERQAVIQAIHSNHHDSLAVARDEMSPCTVVDDPSGFIVDLERELGRMRRFSDSSCLLTVTPEADIDIKAIDDLGDRFAANLRAYDALCRYGSNRFLVLLPNIQHQDVPGVVRRLRVQVVGYPLVLTSGENAFVSVATGGTMLDTNRAMQENIDRAVLACAAAVRQGGNTYQMWSPSLESA